MKNYLVHSKGGSKYRSELFGELVVKLDEIVFKQKNNVGAVICEIDNQSMIIDFVNTKEDILENEKRFGE